MTGYVVLVAELGRVGVLGAEPVHRVLEVGREPAHRLKGRADALERVLLCASLLDEREALLERGAQIVEQVDQRMICLVRTVRLRVERVVCAPLFHLNQLN